MTLTIEQLEARIRELLKERQTYLDKANGCAGAITELQSQLQAAIEEKAKADTRVIGKKK